MKKVSIFLTVTLFSFITNAQTTWKIDQSHSKVGFSVSHLVISEVDGNFKSFDGTITTSNNDFSDAKISFSVDINSINTENAKRDGHLKSEDFFYAEKYPKMTFKSTSLKKYKGNKYILKGELTMRGVSKKITLEVRYGVLPKMVMEIQKQDLL